MPIAGHARQRIGNLQPTHDSLVSDSQVISQWISIRDVDAVRGRIICFVMMILACWGSLSHADEVTPDGPFRESLFQIISSSRRELIDRQLESGAFPADGFLTHELGTTSLAVLALSTTGLNSQDPPVQFALKYLRKQAWGEARRTHEVALGIMAFVAAGQPVDTPLLESLAQQLVAAQTDQGGWPHLIGGADGDLSSSYFAVLALRDLANTGIHITPDVWAKIQVYWHSLQNEDGGWYDFAVDAMSSSNGRPHHGPSTATASLAGMVTLTLCREMLQRQATLNARTPVDCCQSLSMDQSLPVDHSIERCLGWLTRSAWQSPLSSTYENAGRQDVFSMTPGISDIPVAFHLYGLEQASRMQADLFAKEAEWWYTGAKLLLAARNPRTSMWEGTNDIMATSHALLFLSTVLRPSLIDKIKFRDNERTVLSQRYPHDVWNLTAHLMRSRDWPRQVACREVELSPHKSELANRLQPRLNARALFLTHPHAPAFSDEDIVTLQAYLERGGVLLAAPECDVAAFEQSLLQLVGRLFPRGEAELNLLPHNHPVYHTWFNLHDEVQLYGVETGCRTAIIYCRDNLACHWEMAAPSLKTRSGGSQSSRPSSSISSHVQQQVVVDRAIRIGSNVIAYAAGDQLTAWPRTPEIPESTFEHFLPTEMDRSLLRVAQIRLEEGGNVAPRALQAILHGANSVHGPLASPAPSFLTLDSPDLFDHLLLFLHGGKEFALTDEQVQALRLHLQRGGLLFADACCGSASFDASFRKLATQLFPDQALKRLPIDHEFYKFSPAFRLQKVKIRTFHGTTANFSEKWHVKETKPQLEGVELNGRLVMIYSRHDVSCALAAPNRNDCEGYVPEDARRIGVNVVMYALLQDLHPPDGLGQH